MPASNARDRLGGLAVVTACLVAVVAVLGTLFLFNPAVSHIFPSCPFYWATGWHCPGCGALRAAHLLLHGDVPGAFAMNPLMLLALPLLPVLGLRRSLAYSPWTAWTALGLLIVFGVARNLHAWPLTLLAPH